MKEQKSSRIPPITIRQLFYVLVAAGLIANTRADYEKLAGALNRIGD
jgi:hypothetical protein